MIIEFPESLPVSAQRQAIDAALRAHQVIVVCGVLCNCDGPTAMHRWALNREEWLREFLELPHGIPSRDCIRRVLMALRPQAFQACFQNWIAESIQADDSGRRRLIAIDGKTCRRSHDAKRGLGALHIVSAWASEVAAIGCVTGSMPRRPSSAS